MSDDFIVYLHSIIREEVGLLVVRAELVTGSSCAIRKRQSRS